MIVQFALEREQHPAAGGVEKEHTSNFVRSGILRCDVLPISAVVACPKQTVVAAGAGASVLQCPAHAGADQAHPRLGRNYSWEAREREAGGDATSDQQAIDSHGDTFLGVDGSAMERVKAFDRWCMVILCGLNEGLVQQFLNYRQWYSVMRIIYSQEINRPVEFFVRLE